MILYLDLASGASGDKLLSALLELGEETGLYSVDALQRGVAALAPEARIETARVVRGGMGGTHLKVLADESPRHRHWADIKEKLETVPMPEGARRRAIRAFTLIAEAEAQVHESTVEHIHFHEVGATDSIVDIVGVSLALDALGVDEFICTPVAVGSGVLVSAHGMLPVPAPATVEILRGVPTYSGAAEGELTTPTGAALLVANVTAWGPMPPMTVAAIGYGAGTRDLDGMPNVLRIIAGDHANAVELSDDCSPYAVEGLILLTTNVDHISPEAVSFAAEQLLDSGARDVWQTPIVMKKGRAATELSVLASPIDARKTAERLHELTGSLGVRRTWVERTIAPRDEITLETPWGSCRYKVGFFGDKRVMRPEHDDVARLACETDLSYLDLAKSLTRFAETND